jgi:tetratricopeptide (TPR) repeat protein
MPRALEITLNVVFGLVFVAGSVWLLVRILKKTTDPAALIFKWTLTAVLLSGFYVFCRGLLGGLGGVVVPFAAVALGIALTILWAPALIGFLIKPLTSAIDGGDEQGAPQPLYSIARAKRKRNQFQEAIYEVHHQLEKFPHDLEGQLLLAEILVEDLKDLAGAQATIERICQQPKHPPRSVAAAFTTLADWQLKHGQDVEGARASFQRIIDTFPDTDMARGASERIAHLAGAAERLMSAHDRPLIHLHVGARDVGLREESQSLRPVEEDPVARAAGYVKHLEQYPQDSEAREKLALIYADHYGRVDLAADQLEQLIQDPHQPARQIARWLNLLADLHIKHHHAVDAAGQALQRIIDSFPNLAMAEAARQRLARLPLEVKGLDAAHTVKMGNYEKDLGLKNPGGAPGSAGSSDSV